MLRVPEKAPTCTVRNRCLNHSSEAIGGVEAEKRSPQALFGPAGTLPRSHLSGAEDLFG